MSSCINNQIQKYIEDSLKYLEKWHKKEFDKTELYEIYKNIRSEYASYGMLRGKINNKEICLTNPRSIASGIIYYWSVKYGIDLTQRVIAESLGIAETSIRNTYKIIGMINDKDVFIN